MTSFFLRRHKFAHSEGAQSNDGRSLLYLGGGRLAALKPSALKPSAPQKTRVFGTAARSISE